MLRSPKPLGERWQLYLESVYLGSNPWQCFPSCFPVKKPWHEKAPLEGGAWAADQHRPSPGLCGHWAGIFASGSLELSLHKAAGARGWKLGKKKIKKSSEPLNRQVCLQLTQHEFSFLDRDRFCELWQSAWQISAVPGGCWSIRVEWEPSVSVFGYRTFPSRSFM